MSANTEKPTLQTCVESIHAARKAYATAQGYQERETTAQAFLNAIAAARANYTEQELNAELAKK